MTTPAPTTTEDFRASLEALKDALGADKSFESNPSNRKGKHYFMWDFVNSTLKMLDSKTTKADKQDIAGRSTFTDVLMTDKTGKLDMMYSSDKAVFSDDIKAKSKNCSDTASRWIAGQPK